MIMGIMAGYEPEKVLEFFEQICAVPHGSGNTKGISDFCVEFAKQRGLEYFQDETNNVVIIKEATKGYENADTVILQGHIDMVCEKTPDSDFDFLKDGLKLRFDGEWLSAENTTLGGDNGIAVAMAMAILDDNTLEHPRLEVIFTSDEEVGLDGANGLDMTKLKGRKLINMDSEEEGIITVSCAGGARANLSLKVSRKKVEGAVFNIAVGGLLGGHSGVDIHLGRASANRLIGRVLNEIKKNMPVSLVKIKGGSFDNVIASTAEAQVVVSRDNANRLAEVVAKFDAVIKNEYKTADKGVFIKAEKLADITAEAISEDETAKIIYMLIVTPQGVQMMSMDIEGLTQTSLNMGVIGMENDVFTQVFSVRSSVSSQKYALLDKLTLIAQSVGGEIDIYNEYPAWEYNESSQLRKLMVDTYEELNGKPMQIAATHGGLECGIFCGKLPDIDCVSVGPDMCDVHSVKERLNIPSVERLWKYLIEVLKRSK